MAAAVEIREPLLQLYSTNLLPVGRQSPSLTKQSQRPKFLLNSASIGASRAARSKSDVENFSSLPAAAAEPIDDAAQAPSVTTSLSRSRSQAMEEQGESCITSVSPSGNNETREAEADDEEQSKSLMQLKMEAMTWAAMAKDYTISSLERRLRQALEIAKAEQERNQELGRLLRESKEREAAAAIDLGDAKQEIGQMIDIEEDLCAKLGDLEVNALEEDRRYRAEIASLTATIEAQDQFITRFTAEALKPFEEPAVQTSQQHALAEELQSKLQTAESEIASLRANLSDAKTELRIAEGLKKSQSRRLALFEKERRHLMRRGALRSVRLAPRAQRKSKTEVAAPGGAGWKVFSVLDFDV